MAWLELRHDWGLCSKHEGLIEMDKGIKDNLTYATILMHEMCHAMMPNVEEDFITQMADDLAVALHRAGLIAEDDDAED